jgi:hypothetical protein
LVAARRLLRGLVTLALVAGTLLLSVTMPASANSNYLGLLSAGKPASPPFVFSPNFLTMSGGGATIVFQISVNNLTNSPQTLTLNFNVHHVLTYYGIDVSDGQPGQPGITFVKGDAPNTTQVLAGTPQTVTVTFPPSGSGPTTLVFSQTVNICGYFQVDVGQHQGLNQVAANLSSGWTRVLGCGLGQRLTPGYWKNHQAATEAQLPQMLGGYKVSTFAQATAIFDAMKCSAPVNCLAAHLLAAELDVSAGSSTCIAGTFLSANSFLTSVGYHGVDSYTLTSAQASTALALEQTLDNYTNDSTSATC